MSSTNNNPLKTTPAVRQESQKQAVLEQLRRIPIIQVACEKSSISRSTFYRMRTEDADFKAAAEEALAEGVAFINDLSEAQLVSMIKDKNFSAIQLWLRHHSAKYAAKIELQSRVVHEQRELTPEEKEIVDRALRLALPTNGNEEPDSLGENDPSSQKYG